MNSKKIFGEVFTPVSLIDEMLDKLPEEVWHNKNLKWLDPACGDGNFLIVIKDRLDKGLENIIPCSTEREIHILTKMLYGIDIQQNNVIDCKLRLDPFNDYNLNIETQDALNFEFWNIQFDIVVGNPPYNSPKQPNIGRKSGRATAIWPKFVIKALEITKENGYICFVHPPRWRKPEDKLWNILRQKQFLFLSIHNVVDGLKTFNADTRYDWYVLQNKNYNQPCKIKDEDNNIVEINFSNWPFLPNGKYEEFSKMIASDQDEKFNLLYSTNYHNNKPFVSRTEDEKHIYPCVNSTAKTKKVNFFSSRDDLGGFGIPKIIIGETGYDIPVLDLLGQFATTEAAFSFELINQEDIHIILKDLDWIKNNLKYFLWLGYRIEYKMFKYIKKGFSKTL